MPKSCIKLSSGTISAIRQFTRILKGSKANTLGHELQLSLSVFLSFYLLLNVSQIFIRRTWLQNKRQKQNLDIAIFRKCSVRPQISGTHVCSAWGLCVHGSANPPPGRQGFPNSLKVERDKACPSVPQPALPWDGDSAQHVPPGTSENVLM